MDLAVEAEIRKLAMELGCATDDLAFLERFDPAQLEELRNVVHHAIDQRFRPVFQRIEKAARLLPASVTARIAMAHFPPSILGRVSTELTPDRAEKLIPQLPTDFIADCAPHMDPARAKPLVAALPMATMMPVANEVVRRGDHVAMGRLLATVPADRVDEVVGLLEGGRDLLLVGYHCEDPTIIDPVVTHLSDDQVASIGRATVEEDLVTELGYVADHLGADQRRRLLDLAPPELADRLADA